MVFSREMCAFIIEHYFTEKKSCQRVRALFQEKFGENRSLPNSSIERIIKRFREDGTVMRRAGSGRKSVVTPEKRNLVRGEVEGNPRQSVRRLGQAVGLSRATTHRVLRGLKLKPYRISVRHELLPGDPAKRVAYCQWFQRFTHNRISVLNNVIYSDEAWVHLDGYVNAQNYRMWASENPHEFRTTGLHPQKLGVWCGISRRRIIGPLFFETTITGDRYREIIRDFVSLLEPDERDCVFQQDGAPAHTARETMDLLREFFGDRLISKFGYVPWPPRSPDLSPPDFFLWGFMKDRIFRDNPPHTIEELKIKITQAIEAIDAAMLKRVFRNKIKRVKRCLEVNGAQFEHLL